MKYLLAIIGRSREAMWTAVAVCAIMSLAAMAVSVSTSNRVLEAGSETVRELPEPPPAPPRVPYSPQNSFIQDLNSSVWTVPWSLRFDPGGRAYVKLSDSTDVRRNGAALLQVMRNPDGTASAALYSTFRFDYAHMRMEPGMTGYVPVNLSVPKCTDYLSTYGSVYGGSCPAKASNGLLPDYARVPMFGDKRQTR